MWVMRCSWPQEHTNVPVERQRLLFRGRLMKDNDALSKHHVEDGHTLLLIARPATQTSSVPPSPVTGPADAPQTPVSACVETLPRTVFRRCLTPPRPHLLHISHHPNQKRT